MNNLAQRQTVEHLVREFKSAAAKVRQGFALCLEAEHSLNAAFTLDHHQGFHVGERRHNWIAWKQADEAIESLTRQAWVCIVERLELRRMMSMARWCELEKMLDKGELPPIEVATVINFAAGYAVSVDTMVVEAVAEVFRVLRPSKRYDGYKTNSEFEVGEKVILERYIEPKWTRGGFTVNHYYEQNLIAIERVFQALDGQGVAMKHHYSQLSTAIKACEGGRGETEYFAFRCYKKGTLHLRFKRLDLLQRLNEIAGGANLKPEAA